MPDFSPVDVMWRSDDGTEIPLKIEDQFSNQPPYATDFYQEIALIILHWSRVEWTLDHILHDIEHIKDANKYEDAPIVSLTKRIKAIKSALKGVEIVGDIEPTDFTTEILSRVKIASQNRKIIAHYNFAEFESGKEPKIIFMDIERRLKTFSIKELQHVRNELKLVEAQLIMFRAFIIHPKVWSESGKFLPPVREKAAHSPDNDRGRHKHPSSSDD